MELHKIFSEELEEATRMGEIDRSTAENLQHEYFDCQVRGVFFISEIFACDRCYVKNMKHFKHVLFFVFFLLSRIIWRRFSMWSSPISVMC